MKLIIGNDCKNIPLENDQSILDVLKLTYGITCPCGGNGKCGKCKVKVLEKEGDTQWKTVLSCMTGDVYAADASALIANASASATVQETFTSEGVSFAKDLPWSGYSIAVDVGTTTLAMYVIDGKSGKVVSRISALNPQSSFGSDVISRILYSYSQPGSDKIIQKVLSDKLAQMIRTTMGTLSENWTIDGIQIVGNPAMVYLLAGIDAHELGVAPYKLSVKEPFVKDSKEIGMDLDPSVPVYFPGSVSAFFGSDLTCGMAATIDFAKGESFIYTDLGTNGEIAVSDGKRILCCSTAAGPAFEGSNISCGIGAVEGALCSVELKNGAYVTKTIGGKAPIGICGSGIVDAMAVLLEDETVDITGRMEGDSVSLAQGVQFTQKDVREIQLAKSAIRAGIEVLLEMLSLSYEDVDKVYIAGGFGSYIRIENCMKIGMLPEMDMSKVVTLGNAAGKGAVALVHSTEAQNSSEDLRLRMEYVELFDSASFQGKYVEHMLFGEE